MGVPVSWGKPKYSLCTQASVKARRVFCDVQKQHMQITGVHIMEPTLYTQWCHRQVYSQTPRKRSVHDSRT